MSTSLEPHLGLHYTECLSSDAYAGTRIYTDGSKKLESTSYAYCVERSGEFIYEYQDFLRPPNTVNQVELTAISKAINWCVCQGLKDVAVFSDSMSSVVALSNSLSRSIIVQHVIKKCRG